MVALAHDGDFVTLRGPITVDYFYRHCNESNCTSTSQVIEDPPVRVGIAAGETHRFLLEDTHQGSQQDQDWNLYIQLISIDD